MLATPPREAPPRSAWRHDAHTGPGALERLPVRVITRRLVGGDPHRRRRSERGPARGPRPRGARQASARHPRVRRRRAAAPRGGARAARPGGGHLRHGVRGGAAAAAADPRHPAPARAAPPRSAARRRRCSSISPTSTSASRRSSRSSGSRSSTMSRPRSGRGGRAREEDREGGGPDALHPPVRAALLRGDRRPRALRRPPVRGAAAAGRARSATAPRSGSTAGRTTVALVPGSRPSELKRLFAPMLEAAERIKAVHPDAQFVVPVASTLPREALEPYLAQHRTIDVKLVDGRTQEVVGASDAAIVKSGTSTLETAIMLRPMIVVYRLSWLTYALARAPRPHRALRAREHPRRPGRRARAPAGRGEPRPGWRRRSRSSSATARRATRSSPALREVRDSLGEPGAPRRVAEEVAGVMCMTESLARRSSASPRTTSARTSSPSSRAILAATPDVDVLVIDDNSPDGTGRLADEIAAREPRVHVLHRAGQAGAREGVPRRLRLGARARLRVRARDGRGLLPRPALPAGRCSAAPGPTRTSCSARGTCPAAAP